MPDEEQLDAGQLREILSNIDDDSTKEKYLTRIGKTINSATQGITGSSPYWWSKRRELAALLEYKSFNNNSETPVVFCSASMAEFHWKTLHKVLYDYFILWGFVGEAEAVKNLANGVATLPEHNSTVHRILQQHLNIVNHVFYSRTATFFQTVLKVYNICNIKIF